MGMQAKIAGGYLMAAVVLVSCRRIRPDVDLLREPLQLGIARGFFRIDRGFRQQPPAASPDASSDRWIGGRVVDAHGLPLWHSRVEVTGLTDSVRTDQDGRFLVSLFEPGPHRVFVFPLGDADEPSIAEAVIEATTVPTLPLIHVPFASVVTCTMLDARHRRRGFIVQRFSLDAWCSAGSCNVGSGVACGIVPKNDEGLPTELHFAWGSSLASIDLRLFGAAGFGGITLTGSRNPCVVHSSGFTETSDQSSQ